MKVTKRFSEFQEGDALIVVTGKQQAFFYELHNGHLLRFDGFKVPKARWSDNEGHFKVRAKGRSLVSGSVREDDRNKGTVRKFLREFRERIKKISVERFSELYILAPKEIKYQLLRMIPSDWQDRIAGYVDGNFSYAHPTLVLERIKKGQEGL